MNEIDIINKNPKKKAGHLMRSYKFPKRIILEFEKENTIYMSLPNGHITTHLPDIVKKQINQMKPKRIVYHVIAEYSSSHCFCICLMYHLLIAENNMNILIGFSWLPVYSINCTIPNWSGDDNLQIKRYRKAIKCIEIRSHNS